MTENSPGYLQNEFYFTWDNGTITVGLSDGYSLVAEIKQVRGTGPWILMMYDPYSKHEFESYVSASTYYYRSIS